MADWISSKEIIAPSGKAHTISSLRLNVAEAMEGKTWVLLPVGFRDTETAKVYPLPTKRNDVQRLAAILIPESKADSGCIYLRRATKKWKEMQRRRQSAMLDMTHRAERVQGAQSAFKADLKELKRQAEEAVAEVQTKAAESIASLTDLFSLGRKGLAGMMEAHLAGQPWQGEEIKASAFRDCFRMVTQAVKGLGLPSDQRGKAAQAVMDEAAAALKDTRQAVGVEDTDGEETAQ